MRWKAFRSNVNMDSGIVNTTSGTSRKVFTLNRNGCSHNAGTGVHVEPEWVFMMGRNMHCHAAREITVAVPNTSMQMHQGTVGSNRGAKLFQWNICRRQRWSSMLFIDLFGFTAPRRSIITL